MSVHIANNHEETHSCCFSCTLCDQPVKALPHVSEHIAKIMGKHLVVVSLALRVTSPVRHYPMWVYVLLKFMGKHLVIVSLALHVTSPARTYQMWVYILLKLMGKHLVIVSLALRVTNPARPYQMWVYILPKLMTAVPDYILMDWFSLHKQHWSFLVSLWFAIGAILCVSYWLGLSSAVIPLYIFVSLTDDVSFSCLG